MNTKIMTVCIAGSCSDAFLEIWSARSSCFFTEHTSLTHLVKQRDGRYGSQFTIYKEGTVHCEVSLSRTLSDRPIYAKTLLELNREVGFPDILLYVETMNSRSPRPAGFSLQNKSISKEGPCFIHLCLEIDKLKRTLRRGDSPNIRKLMFELFSQFKLVIQQKELRGKN